MVVAIIAGMIVAFCTVQYTRITEPIKLSENEIFNNYINENVKGAIYIYNNTKNHQDMTMLLINNGNELFDDAIQFYISFDGKCKLSVRENGSDVTGYLHKPDINVSNSNDSSITWKVSWEKDNGIYVPLGRNSYLYANFSLDWESDFKEEFYSIYNSNIIIKNSDFTEKITNSKIIKIPREPQIINIGSPPKWDIDVLWNDISNC